MNHAARTPTLSRQDRWLAAFDGLLKTLAGAHTSARPRPGSPDGTPTLSTSDRKLSGALMRVNHVGEVCAQALYTAQSLSAHDPALRHAFDEAARDEIDHLAWTRQRLGELQTHASLLNPLWYVGAFGIGWIAGRISDPVSLGFVVETERQVEKHLAGHLGKLPADDHDSRAIVQRMKEDEARHADEAEKAGAALLPWPVRGAMRLAARFMTTVAHRI